MQLKLMQVTACNFGEYLTGVRWTLGPDWWADNLDNDDLCVNVFSEEENLELVRGWAERAIREASQGEYQVMGWEDDVTPKLARVTYSLEVYTTDGRIRRISPDFHAARAAITSLGERGVLSFRQSETDENGNATTRETHIPAGTITTLERTITLVPVLQL